MYIGIKYEQRLKNVNNQLNSFGSALMFHGKTKYCFKNPIVALRVAKTLNSANKSFKYSLYKIENENIKNLIFIKTYQDFEDYRNEKHEKENTL